MTETKKPDSNFVDKVQRDKSVYKDIFRNWQWQSGCIYLFDSVKCFDDLKEVLSKGDANSKIFATEYILPSVFKSSSDSQKKKLLNILRKNLKEHKMCENSGYVSDRHAEQEDAESVDGSARDFLKSLEYFGISRVKELYSELEWKVDWQCPEKSPEEINITFEPAIQSLEELKKLLLSFHREHESCLSRRINYRADSVFAERMLRAKQQYRGEKVEDYLVSQEIVKATQISCLGYETGNFKIVRVIVGKEYLSKIDEAGCFGRRKVQEIK